MLEYDLENIIRKAQAKGIKVILMSYPDVDYQDDIRVRVAKKYRIAYIDIFSKFKKLLERFSYKDLFSDDGTHCNAEGYRVMAEEAYQTLKSDINLGPR